MVSFSGLVHAGLSLVWIANGPVATNAMADHQVPADLTPIEYIDRNDSDFPLLGYLSYPDSMMDDDSQDLLPTVVIVPDFDNVNEYEMKRAKMINELGYIAFIADIYGPDLHDVQDFQIKVEQATKYRSDPDLFEGRIQAAIDRVKLSPATDTDKIAIIGYCLGGTGVLGYSFSNTENSDIVGAVSFHGGLMDFGVTGSMANPVLVLSGGDDDVGTAVEALESNLKEANSTWQITRYSGVVHGFTVFDTPAYNEWVDHRSWDEMISFLMERFGALSYGTLEPIEDMEYTVVVEDGVGIGASTMRMAGDHNETTMHHEGEADVWVQTVSYDNDGFALEGYLVVPSDVASSDKRPAVVVLPDWDGVNGPTGYEAERAVMIAQEAGYVAMVADIYGTEYTNVDDFNKRVELATLYRSDPALFVGRIQAAIDQLVAHPNVDVDYIFVAGYCLGGTGAIDFAFTEGLLTSVKAVVPIHGGLSPLREITTESVDPYVLILSGGVDDAHGNTTELEAHLDGANATWEISRYSNAEHGFTKWGVGPFSAYNEMADSRSWWSMMSLFSALSADSAHAMGHHEGEVHLGGEHSHVEDDHDPDHDHDDEKDEGSSANSPLVGLSVIASVATAAAMFAMVAC